MAEKKPIIHEQTDFFTRAEEFYEKNSKAVIAGGVALLVLALGSFYFYASFLPKREAAAQEQMFKAQEYFRIDSFRLALGEANSDGFLQVIEDYSWTKASNLSHYYAGLCYLHLDEYDNAIEHLKKFSNSEPYTGALALGALGDAYSEKNEMDEAISYYKKAAKKNKNDLTTPYFLFKAGLALKVQGNKEEALKFFQEIKNDYPNSKQGKEIDSYIGMVS